MKILVVDDESVIVKGIRFNLQSDGYEVICGSNGLDALRLTREEKPDLVIVTGDIAFPVPYKAGTLNNLASAKVFAALMEKLGVYWTLAFGNHDTEAYSYYSREDISDFYENSGFKYCPV